jgi:hypothetical protein
VVLTTALAHWRIFTTLSSKLINFSSYDRQLDVLVNFSSLKMKQRQSNKLYIPSFGANFFCRRDRKSTKRSSRWKQNKMKCVSLFFFRWWRCLTLSFIDATFANPNRQWSVKFFMFGQTNKIITSKRKTSKTLPKQLILFLREY